MRFPLLANIYCLENVHLATYGHFVVCHDTWLNCTRLYCTTSEKAVVGQIEERNEHGDPEGTVSVGVKLF